MWKQMNLDTARKRYDPYGEFDMMWGSPAFGTIGAQLINGTVTAGTVIDQYTEAFQVNVDALFDGWAYR